MRPLNYLGNHNMRIIDNPWGRNCLTSNMFAIYGYELWILQNIMNRQGRAVRELL